MNRVILLALLLSALCGCRKGMVEDGRVKPLEESNFFHDGTTARAPVEGTVARGGLESDSAFSRSEVHGRLVAAFPMPVTRPLLKRGQERFEIFCSPCHGRTGAGDGEIARRGYPAPPTYHQPRLRDAPPGYLFGVITRGYGVMYSYADRIQPADRWAIVAYIRALQLSQNATWNDIPLNQRDALGSPPQAPRTGGPQR